MGTSRVEPVEKASQEEGSLEQRDTGEGTNSGAEAQCWLCARRDLLKAFREEREWHRQGWGTCSLCGQETVIHTNWSWSAGTRKTGCARLVEVSVCGKTQLPLCADPREAGFKVGVLRSDGTQEMGYRWRWVGAGGLHTGREERKVESHPPTGLGVCPVPCTHSFLLVMNVLSRPMATGGTVGMGLNWDGSLLSMGGSGWAQQILFQRVHPVH